MQGGREASAKPAHHHRPSDAISRLNGAEVTYQRVTGDLGPIHLIGSPRVVVETRPTKAFVWIENAVWGWPDLRREFLNAQSPKVARYAKSLALMIQAAAVEEQSRRNRQAELREREREAVRQGRKVAGR